MITFCIFPCAANTKPLIDDPKALFRKLDADKSGSLTKDEVIKGAIEFKMTPAQAGALFDALDKDGSGTLSLEELSMMENHKKFSEEWELAQGELVCSIVFIAVYGIGPPEGHRRTAHGKGQRPLHATRYTRGTRIKRRRREKQK